MQLFNRHYPGFNPVQVGYQNCTPGWAYGPGARPYWLLHYIVNGKGILRRDGVIHHVNKGDIFVIPPYGEAYYRADDNQPWEYAWIAFLADAIPEDVLSKPILHCPEAERIFRDMCRCGYMGNGKAAYLCSRLWELMSLLLEEDTTPPDHIVKAIEYIHAHYDNTITVADLAAELHLNRTYFATLFKKRVGVSPIDYLTNLRMNQAAQLLCHHGRSPTVAALSVGYTDYSHFSKAFKKHFGCSPRLYQRTHIDVALTSSKK